MQLDKIITLESHI